MDTVEKVLWSIRIVGIVASSAFEDSATDGKRVMLTIRLPHNEPVRLRLTHLVFHHLMEKMKGSWDLREEFTTADGEQLLRWIRSRAIKIRVVKLERSIPGMSRNPFTRIDFIELLD